MIFLIVLNLSQGESFLTLVTKCTIEFNDCIELPWYLLPQISKSFVNIKNVNKSQIIRWKYFLIIVFLVLSFNKYLSKMLNLFRGQLTRVIQTRRLFSTMRLSTSHPGDQRPLSQICESYPQTFPSSSSFFSKSQFLTQQIRFKSDIPSVHNEDKQISKGNNKGEEFM